MVLVCNQIQRMLKGIAIQERLDNDYTILRRKKKRPDSYLASQGGR